MDNNFFNIQSYEKIFYYKPLPDDTLLDINIRLIEFYRP